MNIQKARQAGFEKFLAEQKKWIEEENLQPLTATEIGSMILAWDAALESVVVENERLSGSDKAYGEVWEKARGLQSEMDQVVQERDELKAEVEVLRSSLLEASEEIASWGAYASEYFQQKYDLAGCVAKFYAIAMNKEQPK